MVDEPCTITCGPECRKARKMAELHKHECSNKECGTVWEHDKCNNNNPASHLCPKCGSEAVRNPNGQGYPHYRGPKKATIYHGLPPGSRPGGSRTGAIDSNMVLVVLLAGIVTGLALALLVGQLKDVDFRGLAGRQ